ncbi:MAG: hypothetical protein Q3979_04985, partial [Actinomycetaceae bacterium]|nr:hypothetical protein [Actinomycetaceae bacterium]
MKEEIMSVKKISALIATSLIALSLSACSLNANDDGPDPIAATQPLGSDSSESSEEPEPSDEPSS